MHDDEDDVYDDRPGFIGENGLLLTEEEASRPEAGRTKQARALGYDYSVDTKEGAADQGTGQGETAHDREAERKKGMAGYLGWGEGDAAHTEHAWKARAGVGEFYESDRWPVLPGFVLPRQLPKGNAEVGVVEETPLHIPAGFVAVHTWDMGRRTRFSRGTEAREEMKVSCAERPFREQVYETVLERCVQGPNSQEIDAFISAMASFATTRSAVAPAAGSAAQSSAVAGLNSRFSKGKTLQEEQIPSKANRDQVGKEEDEASPIIPLGFLPRSTSAWQPHPLLLKRCKVKQNASASELQKHTEPTPPSRFLLVPLLKPALHQCQRLPHHQVASVEMEVWQERARLCLRELCSRQFLLLPQGASMHLWWHERSRAGTKLFSKSQGPARSRSE